MWERVQALEQRVTTTLRHVTQQQAKIAELESRGGAPAAAAPAQQGGGGGGMATPMYSAGQFSRHSCNSSHKARETLLWGLQLFRE